jgi:hypothetical protein
LLEGFLKEADQYWYIDYLNDINLIKEKTLRYVHQKFPILLKIIDFVFRIKIILKIADL